MRVTRILCLMMWMIGSICTAEPLMRVEAEVRVYDDQFHRVVGTSPQLVLLGQGYGWAEGPVWVESLDALLFSDVAQDKVLRWDEQRGVTDYLFPSGHAPDREGVAWRGANGLAIDPDGMLILAQQSSRRVVRMLAPLSEPKAEFAVLANRYGGKHINTPNDVTVHQNGAIYFTDPPYGLDGFEQNPAIELDFFGVFRFSVTGELSVVHKGLSKPNGLALSPDHSRLYISNSQKGDARIIAVDLDRQGLPRGSREFFDARPLEGERPGSTDGMAMHPGGFLFASLPDGFGVLSCDGRLLGRFVLGQVTNLAFDNAAAHLFVTTPHRLLRMRLTFP